MFQCIRGLLLDRGLNLAPFNCFSYQKIIFLTFNGRKQTIRAIESFPNWMAAHRRLVWVDLEVNSGSVHTVIRK